MNNVSKTIKSLFYALPFGLKAADSEIMSSGDISNGEDTTVEKKVSQNTLMEALLRGELTEEVKEFRYGTYKIDENAIAASMLNMRY
jgi:anti-sigma28 factor (negative regulator of flagellin synthesis)